MFESQLSHQGEHEEWGMDMKYIFLREHMYGVQLYLYIQAMFKDDHTLISEWTEMDQNVLVVKKVFDMLDECWVVINS